MDSVHVLIVEAVYDHGVVGVFTTEERAREVAEVLWRDSDGHHSFRVERLMIDAVYDPSDRDDHDILRYGNRRTESPLRLEAVERAPITPVVEDRCPARST